MSVYNPHTGLWEVAFVSKTRYREASFGGGRPSSSIDMFKLCWDPVDEAFVSGRLFGFGGGDPWHTTKYPCERQRAQIILDLCREDDVQKRFLRSSFSETVDEELYIRSGHAVHLHRSKAIWGNGKYLVLAHFSFRFFGPAGTVHYVSLNDELTQVFAQNILARSPESIANALNGIRAAA